MTEQWEKDRKKFKEELPSRFLSLTCILIGFIHFGMSGWKADWVLFAFVVLCFAPWLGYVFESITKDGVKFRKVEQGEILTPAKNQDPVGPVAPQAAVLEPPAQFQPQNAIPPAPQPGSAFDQLSSIEKKIMATLWKYQKMHFPGSRVRRWTFIVGPGLPDYMAFQIGFSELARKGFANLAPTNNQVVLTDLGIEFCQTHDAAISSWPNTYDNFSN